MKNRIELDEDAFIRFEWNMERSIYESFIFHYFKYYFAM